MPFPPVSRHADNVKSRGVQIAAHLPGGGIGGGGAPRGGVARDLPQQRGVPKLGVAGRGEAVEEPGVDPRVQLRQHGVRVAERLAITAGRSPHNEHYLATKVGKLGHMMALGDPAARDDREH